MKKNTASIASIASIITIAFFLENQVHGEEDVNKMRLMGKEAMAIASACGAAKYLGIDIRKYELYISETELSYTISFVDMEKPEGFRGSRTGFPQPVLKVDKNSGEIIEQTFSR